MTHQLEQAEAAVTAADHLLHRANNHQLPKGIRDEIDDARNVLERLLRKIDSAKSYAGPAPGTG